MRKKEAIIMRGKRTKRIPNKINRILEIPQEVSSNVPKITILGFEQMMIENYKAILEYQDFYIRLSTEIGILNINGFHLNLKEMTTDDLQISGKIDSIDFEAIEDDENNT